MTEDNHDAETPYPVSPTQQGAERDTEYGVPAPEIAVEPASAPVPAPVPAVEDEGPPLDWVGEIRGLFWMLFAVLAFHSFIAKPF